MQGIFLLDIAPLVRIALSREQIFSYSFSSPLPIGSLVEIPLGKNRVVKGVVVLEEPLRLGDSAPPLCRGGNKSIKSVISLLSPGLLTEKQIDLARFIAETYFVSLGIALKLFLPPDFKKRKIQKKENGILQKITLTPEQKKASKEIIDAKKPIFLTGSPSSGKTEVLIDVVQKFLTQKKQVLFLLPEIALTPHTIERLFLRLGKSSIEIFHSGQTDRERSLVWKRIASGDPCVVVGSRSALFLPFQALGLVILDEEHDDSYKQTLKSPRYDARAVADKLSEIHATKIIRSSATPRCETKFLSETKILHTVSLPSFLAETGNLASLQNSKKKAKNFSPLHTIQAQVRIIDMRLAHWKSKQKRLAPPILSDELKEAIFHTLKNKEQAILLVSRQGMNAFTICTHCKNIFRCPKCDRALVPQRSGHFLCLGGHFRTQAFPKCPACGGIQFVGHGVGTQKVEEEIRRLFQYANIARLDSQSLKQRAFRESIFRDMTEKKVDILIGTQMIAKGWDIPHLSLIGVIDTDAFFSFPDFSTDLRTTQLLFQAKGRLGRIGNNHPGTLLLQTYHADRPALLALEKNAYSDFLQTEMETREALKYPPYAALIRLVGKDTNEANLRAQGLSLYKSLAKIAPETLLVSRPAKSLKRQKFGWFCRSLVLKNLDPNLPPDIRKILENLPKSWYVDNMPISLS